ncbi:two-component system, cell cycle sensor histidine kinase PleC [uncultured Gammaproteobacteria bacterium]
MLTPSNGQPEGWRSEASARVKPGKSLSQPIQILLVERGPETASNEIQTVRDLLACADYGTFEISHVVGLARIVDAVGRSQPDVVVVDLGPSGDRDQAILSDVRALISDLAIPIIALTDQSQSLLVLRSLYPEAEDVLVKGQINQGALPRVIHNALERRTLMANLHRIIVNNPDAIVVVNDTGHVLFANPAASRLFDRAISDLLDQQFGFPVVGSGTIEIDIGVERVAEMRVVEIDWLNRQAFLTSLRDITDHKRSARQMERLKNMAEQANRAKSAFLATMSHELRTPLTSIIGFSEIIRDQLLGPTGNPLYAEYAGDINTSGAHLLTLINDILDIAKIESGKMEIDPEPLDVSTVVQGTVRLLNDAIMRRRLKLHSNIGSDIGVLRADRRAFKQIVFNLLSNAIKFTPEGGQITLSAMTSPIGGLDITIADTGIGIPSDRVSGLMRPFEQLDNSFGRSAGGTGLGLSLVKALTDLHQGSVAIDSTPGIGTRVTVHFPSTQRNALESVADIASICR